MTTFSPKSTDNTNVGTLYSSYGFAYKALMSLHGSVVKGWEGYFFFLQLSIKTSSDVYSVHVRDEHFGASACQGSSLLISSPHSQVCISEASITYHLFRVQLSDLPYF